MNRLILLVLVRAVCFLSVSSIVSASEWSRVDATAAPYNAAGFVEIVRSADGVLNTTQCSGQYVSENVILTAAHCLKGNIGEWEFEELTFFQQYDDGPVAPIKPVKGTKDCYVIPAEWRGAIKLPYDYAFVKVGATVGPIFNIGIQDLIVGQELVAIGYPADSGFGDIMFEVRGSYVGKNVYTGIQMAGNSFSKRSSGGAWIEPNTSNVVGLNSSIHPGPEMHSPAFTAETLELLAYVESGCG